jgi:hypothetical protein
MQGEDTGAMDAVAQLFAQLGRYEAALDGLALQGWSAPLYAELSAAFAAARDCAGDLPQLGMAWAVLMVHHFELARGLWMMQGTVDAAGERLVSEHRLLLAALRERCERLAAR